MTGGRTRRRSWCCPSDCGGAATEPAPISIGQTIDVDSEKRVVAGVVADVLSDVPGVRYSLFGPLPNAGPAARATGARGVGWLRPGVSLAAARAEFQSVSGSVDERGRRSIGELQKPTNIFWDVGELRDPQLALMAAVFLLLMIAIVNVANLLMASGHARLGELGVRGALGASRFRIARLLLVESVVLAVAGAAGGLFIAWAAVHVFTALNPGPQLQTQLESIRLDGVVVGYTITIALLTAAAFGVVPALRGSAAPPRSRLQETGGRSATRGWPRALIAVEVALSLVLLIAAGLVGRAFLQMRLADPGFAADRVLGIRIALPEGRYGTPERQTAFFDDLLARAARLPGVTAASLGYGAMPPSDLMAHGEFETADGRQRAANVWISVGFVSPGHFALTGIPLLAGTGFKARHLQHRDAAAEIPVVISSSLRRRFWGDRNPVGDGFYLTDSRGTRRYRILGVAGDASGRGLINPACAECQWQMYAPLPETRPYTEVLLRLADGAPPPVVGLRAAIGRIDPGVPSDASLETAAASLHGFLGQHRFRAALFGGFAALAVALAALGLFAVVFHSIKQRTREIGIRIALGARPAQVRRLVLAEGLRPTAVGIGAGLLVAALVTRTLASFLNGISPTDWPVFLGSAALLSAVALGAILGPGLRATRVNPVQALRSE